MSKCKCQDCGWIGDDHELEKEEWYESRGEFWGSPCSEHMVEMRCPHCGSDDIDEYYENDEEI